jgi:putative RNA 2'-phosphotransferase
MAIDRVKLSKTVSHALRHEPWLYGLELDAEGWVDADELLSALAAADPAWAELQLADLSLMIGSSAKSRHELRGSRIRALYGHSTPERIVKQPEPPPARLFHGTSPLRLPAIQQLGLQAMARQYVHLAVTPQLAREVGRRKHPNPVILRVISDRAAHAGIPFYPGNDETWLADSIPPEFLEFPDP